jgi:hypothetical protein
MVKSGPNAVNDFPYSIGLYRDDGATPNGVINFGRGSTTNNGHMTFDVNSVEAMRIISSGNVGIGTEAPAQLLQVGDGSSGTSNTIRIEGRTTGGGQEVATLEFNQFSSLPVEFIGASLSLRSDTGRSNSALVFNVSQAGNTSATEAMRIDRLGHAIIPAGVTLGTAAGVYSADKTLDDYEEGTWTPVISDGTDNATSDVAVATYTKIGNHVHVQGRIRITSFGAVNGALRITGLPFNSKTVSNNFSAMTIGRAAGLNLTAGTTVCGDLRSNVGHVLLVVWDAALGNTGLQDTEFSSDGDISFSMNYLSV